VQYLDMVTFSSSPACHHSSFLLHHAVRGGYFAPVAGQRGHSCHIVHLIIDWPANDVAGSIHEHCYMTLWHFMQKTIKDVINYTDHVCSLPSGSACLPRCSMVI